MSQPPSKNSAHLHVLHVLCLFVCRHVGPLQGHWCNLWAWHGLATGSLGVSGLSVSLFVLCRRVCLSLGWQWAQESTTNLSGEKKWTEHWQDTGSLNGSERLARLDHWLWLCLVLQLCVFLSVCCRVSLGSAAGTIYLVLWLCLVLSLGATLCLCVCQ